MYQITPAMVAILSEIEINIYFLDIKLFGCCMLSDIVVNEKYFKIEYKKKPR